MFKKAAAIGFSLALAAGLLAGCGSGKDTTAPQGGGAAKGYVPTQLKVQFVPSQNAGDLDARVKPLEKLLSDRLGIPVKVSVSTTYNTLVEAMASKQVDVGFLPPNGYVKAKEQGAAELIVQAQRLGVNPDGSSSSELVDSYRAMILVKADSPIKSLQDLKGKKVAVQDTTSSAGYVWPAVELKKAGIDPEKDITPVKLKGHDQGVLAVLNGDADAAFVFEDARNIVKKDKPDIFEKVTVLHRTDKIPNDTISVRSDMDKEWVEKIKKAFIEIGKDPEGKKIIKEIYTHEGYVEGSDKNFDVVREYSKALKN